MDVKTRLDWIRLYEQLGDAGRVCRRCGISRPTLRKWWRRYQAAGIDGLKERSRRPRRQASQKVFEEQEALILALRRERQLGIKRLRSELIRQHGLTLSLDTLHRVLVRHGEQHLKRRRLPRKGSKRYSRPIPGDRVPMDTCKIAPGVYQYTAIDDCSRYKVLGVYPRRSATNTLAWHCHSNGWKFVGRADNLEAWNRSRMPPPVSTRRHSAGRAVVSPVYVELPGRRGTAGRARA